MSSAAAIYQDNLDAVTDALWRGDVPGILNHIALPNSMVTEDASYIINSIDEMTIVATEFRDHLTSIGADGYHRLCLSARYVTDNRDMIIGLHETRMVNGGVCFGTPYLNRMTLLKRNGNWQGVMVEAETSNEDLTILSPDLAESQMQELARIGITLNRR